jgi:hypothetical protein
VKILAPAIASLVLGTTSLSIGIDALEEPARAEAGLAAAMPEVAVERFPLGDPIPFPVPHIAPARLRVEGLDRRLLCDVQPFDEQGAPIPAAFEAIGRAFSAKSGHAVDMDPRLIEILVTLSQAFGGATLTLVSGHREAGYGTRKSSHHVAGQAADVYIRGVKLRDLRDAAIRLGARGVGLYPSFLHVDARDDEPYYWSGANRRRYRPPHARPHGRPAHARRR